MSEWQLLVDAEGISVGDSIVVENEDGGQLVLTLVRWSEKTVWLRDDDEKVWKFCAESLEHQEDGYPIIIGRA
jgi:hypothetical protein